MRGIPVVWILFQWLGLLVCCGNDPLEKQSFCCQRADILHGRGAGLLLQDSHGMFSVHVHLSLSANMHKCVLASYYMEPLPFEPAGRVTFY